ncbi:hypothetical protein HPB51_009865 [Rhipicephalus microplus]|uniref:Uncharacterized protein n=1 Tax=Rhipicephalus microplus TaxID=6941 RepID=A0A9J6ESG7_RHIMP|nr:hypothetical protein HPB51_009865 [Rhipicephalus microplus]
MSDKSGDSTSAALAAKRAARGETQRRRLQNPQTLLYAPPGAVAVKTRKHLPPKQKLGGAAAGKILPSALLKLQPNAAGWQRGRAQRRRPSSRLQTVHLEVRVPCLISPNSRMTRNHNQMSVPMRPPSRRFLTQTFVGIGPVRHSRNLWTTFLVFLQLPARKVHRSQRTSRKPLR